MRILILCRRALYFFFFFFFFWYVRLLSGDFCLSSGICGTFFLCLPPPQGGSGSGVSQSQESRFARGAVLEKVCRRIVVVPAPPSPASFKFCLHGFPLRLWSLCVFVGQDRVAVFPWLERFFVVVEEFLSTVQPVQFWKLLLGILASLLRLVLGGQLRMRILQLAL